MKSDVGAKPTVLVKLVNLKTPVNKVNETRKIRKPLMEKRRRARINDCLNELKRMLLETEADLKHPGSRPAKLEKADILELTVRHVRRLHREGRGVADKFNAGFRECAKEVRTELVRFEAGDEALKDRLLTHLSSCLTGPGATEAPEEVSSSTASPPPQGLTLRPTKLANGDLAFVIPAELQRRTVLQSKHEPRESHAETGPVWRPW